jgi:hypothetical protein
MDSQPIWLDSAKGEIFAGRSFTLGKRRVQQIPKAHRRIVRRKNLPEFFLRALIADGLKLAAELVFSRATEPPSPPGSTQENSETCHEHGSSD